MTGRNCPKCHRELPDATLHALERGTPCPFCAAPLKRSPRRPPTSPPTDDGYAAFQVSQTPPPFVARQRRPAPTIVGTAPPPAGMVAQPPQSSPQPSAMAMTALLPSTGSTLTFASPAMGLSLRPGRNLVVAGAAAVIGLVAAVVLLHRSPAQQGASLSAVPHETPRAAPVIEPVQPETVPPARTAQTERVAPASATPAAHAAPTAKQRVRAAHQATTHRRRYAKREKRSARQTQVAARAPVAAGDPRASYERGNSLLFAGDAPGAVAAYREAVQLAPADPIGYRGLGLAYEQQGQTASAIRALHRYLKLASGAADRAIISRRIDRLSQTASHK